jgi:hypothetical protein
MKDDPINEFTLFAPSGLSLRSIDSLTGNPGPSAKTANQEDQTGVGQWQF